MPNDNEKNLNDVADVGLSNDDIIDLDAGIKTKKKNTKKSTKKTSKNKKEKTKKNKTNSKSSKSKVKSASKAKSKSSKTKKTSSVTNISTRKKVTKSIEDELLKITNIKSVEQIKKPKKIAMMISFYAIIALAIVVFCLIKFSKPKKSDLLLEESINYDFLTEKIETTTRIIEESSSENDETTNIRDRLTELTTKSINSYKTESTERVAEDEPTRQLETTKQNETKKQTETTKQLETKSWPRGTSINEILPRYKEVIYPYAVYNQMSLEEIGIVNSILSENYRTIENRVFGEDIPFDTKGANGIIYLNYTYLKQYMEDYTRDTKQVYDQLPVAPYYDYIMNDKFKFNHQTYTTNLNMRLDFKSAKSRGAYFEIPATIIEPKGSNVSTNGTNKTIVRVLKKAKVGYTESFALSALLEVLDIECHTKHNPFFDVEEITGLSPKIINDMRESGFDVRATIEDETFNYVLFDKKGYITALYMVKS